MRSALPDKSWPESSLLDLIRQSGDEDFGEANRYRLLLALDELTSRAKIRNPARTFTALLFSGAVWGRSDPEKRKISVLLARLCSKQSSLFPKLLRKAVSGESSPALVSCVTNALPLLQPRLQSRAISPLAGAIENSKWAGDSSPMQDIVSALLALGEASMAQAVTRELIPMLSTPANFPAFAIAVRIASKVSGSEVVDRMLNLLRQSLDGYFPDVSLEQHLLYYFERNPVEQAVPLVIRTVKQRGRLDLIEMIPRFQHDSMTRELLNLLEDSIATPFAKYDLSLWALRSLAKRDLNAGDVRSLIRNPILRREGSEFRFYLIDITSKMKDLKQELLNYLSGQDETLRTFAADCLRKMHVSIDEITAHTKMSPVSAAYAFFFPDDTITKLWVDKASLGSNTKGQGVNRFDFLVNQLLACLNFLFVYVDKSKREGIDVIALSPTSNFIIAAAVTIGVIKDDLQKLDRTVQEMKETPGFEGSHVLLPVLFTTLSAETITPGDSQFADQRNIVILTSSDIDEIVLMAKTGRTHLDLIQFLNRKTPFRR